MGLVEGKRVIVTGGGHNLGEAYCKGLAAEGASVIVAEIAQTGAERVAKEGPAEGGQAVGLPVNFADPESVQPMVTAGAAELDGLDALVTNAAIYAGLQWLPPDLIDFDEWDWVMAVDIKGPFLCAQAAAPLIAGAGGGSTINVASTTAEQGGLQPVLTLEALASADAGSVLMLPAVILATRKLLQKAGLPVEDIADFEVKEPFASVVLACRPEFGVPDEKTDPLGGAVAYVHTLGATGGPLMGSLAAGLSPGEYGVVTNCGGGGVAAASLLRRW